VDRFETERNVQFRRVAIGTGGESIGFGRALHVESLVRSLVVELLEKIVELGLLFGTLHKPVGIVQVNYRRKSAVG
jgi:hypothetical protein